MSSELEQTHYVCSKAFVFQVPKLDSNDGFKASAWPKTSIWSGRVRVVSKGDKNLILLEHVDKDGLFASCPIENDKTVEQTTDSSRYFALRVSDGKGRHAVLGLGFGERTQAFDFKVAVQDQLKSTKAEEMFADTPAQNFALPQGGKITISLGKGLKKKESTSTSSSSSSSGGLSASLGALTLNPPTPAGASSSSTSSEPAKKKKEKKAESSADNWVTF